MRLTNGRLFIDLSPELLDDALAGASRAADPDLRLQYESDREAVASIEIVDIREERFRELDRLWAERFGIGKPLLSVLAENEGLACRISGCAAERVRSESEEGASLQPSDDEKLAVLFLRLRADSLLSREKLLELVRAIS